LWSFLMASAHGAGLMLVPVLLAWPAANGADPTVSPYGSTHLSHAGQLASLHLTGSDSLRQWPAAVGVHTVGYFSVAALVALLVYEKLGVGILRRAWFNLDLVWMVALMLSGILILLV